MKAGDFQVMTAGSGVVHTETIDKKAKLRLLQLWLVLPKKNRWTMPRLQNLSYNDVSKISEKGLNIYVYSGSLGGVASPILNYVPLIVADIQLQPGVKTTQVLPASYNTFLYMLEGNINVGEDDKVLKEGQVGWLDKFSENSQSKLQLESGELGGRAILYSAEPQGDNIVSHGPFIGDTQEDISRLNQEYRQGKMKHISTYPEAQLLSR